MREISNELRAVEREIDNVYRNNALTAVPFAQAAWHFFAHFEDHFVREYIEQPESESAYHAIADNMINHSRWALNWLRTACPPSDKRIPAYNDDLYGHAMALSELAMNYGSFVAAYTYASQGLVQLVLDGSRIGAAGPMIDDERYEAYDDALMNKTDDFVLDTFDPSFMGDVHASLRLTGTSFEYALNPKIIQKAVECLRPSIDARFSLPDHWEFRSFTLDDFRRVARVLYAISIIHFASRLSAARVGCPALGVARALILMQPTELTARITRYSGVAASVVAEIVKMLTFGSGGQTNPDPALQPLLQLSPSLIGIAPNLLMNSSIERNFSALLNRVPDQRLSYTALSQTKEPLMSNRLREILEAMNLRFWSGNIAAWGAASEIDLVIISDHERCCLVLELKAFTAPADPREVWERSEEIEKGIKQIKDRKAACASAPAALLGALGVDPTYRISWTLASESSIGAPYVQDPTVPVVNAGHLAKRLRKKGSLASTLSWLENREYLPIAGVHYRRVPKDVSIGKWTLEWYGIEVIADDYASL